MSNNDKNLIWKGLAIVLGWAALLYVIFATGVAKAQDTHDAIAKANYSIPLRAFTWIAIKHNGETDEKVAGSEREFDITYSKRLMGQGGEARQFPEAEQKMMLKNMTTLAEFHAQLFKEPVTQISWDAEKGVITTTVVTDSGEKEYKLDKAYKIVPEIELSKDQADTMYGYAALVLEYLLESIAWWDAGEGKFLDKAGQ